MGVQNHPPFADAHGKDPRAPGKAAAGASATLPNLPLAINWRKQHAHPGSKNPPARRNKLCLVHS